MPSMMVSSARTQVKNLEGFQVEKGEFNATNATVQYCEHVSDNDVDDISDVGTGKTPDSGTRSQTSQIPLSAVALLMVRQLCMHADLHAQGTYRLSDSQLLLAPCMIQGSWQAGSLTT